MKKKNTGKQKYQYLGVRSKSIRIKENDLWGINSLEGEELLSIDYLEVFTLPSGFGLIAARKEGSWSLFDKKGNKVNSDTYDYIYPYYGLFSITKVRMGNKWGLINKYGEKVTPIQYKEIERFGKGLVLQTFNSSIDFVDYDNLLHFNNISANIDMNTLKEASHKSATKLRKKKIKTS
ncbi:MAG: WG repeat-containing protein [Ignavibacteriae bacterium]|nr:WG repeat-containing protein [Ignavibacteriota bacterium]